MKRRLLSVLLCVVLLSSLMPMVVNAAEYPTSINGSLTDARIGMSATTENNASGACEWTASDSTINGTATGTGGQYMGTSTTTTVILTNNATDSATLSFDYTMTPNSSTNNYYGHMNINGGPDIGGQSSSSIQSGHEEFELAAGGSVEVSIFAYKGDTNNHRWTELELKNITLTTSGGGEPGGQGTYQAKEGYNTNNGLLVGDNIDLNETYYVNISAAGQEPEYKELQITKDSYYTLRDQDWTINSGKKMYYLPSDASTSKASSFQTVYAGEGNLYTQHTGVGIRTVINNSDAITILKHHYGIRTDYYWRDSSGQFHRVYAETEGVVGKWKSNFYYYTGDGEEPTGAMMTEAEWNAVKDQFVLIGAGPDFGPGNPSVSQVLYTLEQGENRLVTSEGELPNSTPRTVNDDDAVVYSGPLYEKSAGYGVTKINYKDSSDRSITIENHRAGDNLLLDINGQPLADQNLYVFVPGEGETIVTPNEYDSDPQLGKLVDSNTNFDGNLFIKKSLFLNNDGEYSVKLESWATGTVSQHTETSVTPSDIILVLDQSGSMGQTNLKKEGMTKTVEEIYASASNNNNARNNGQGATYNCRSAYVDDDSGQYIYIYKNADNTFDLKIGPYTDSKYVQIPKTSGSGKENAHNVTADRSVPIKYLHRADALRAATSEFIDSVAAIKDENGNPAHRIAMVGYAATSSTSQGVTTYTYSNTGVYDGGQSNGKQVPYAERESHYASALKSLDADGVQELHNYAVMYETDGYGKTFVKFGLEMAEGILSARTGDSAKRPAVVILFSDGRPGMETDQDGFTEADAAMAYAKNIKSSGASIYSIGLLTSDESSTVLNKKGTHSENGVAYTAADFLKAVSSAYPSAGKLPEVGTAIPLPDTEYCQITDGTDTNLSELFEAVTKTVDQTSTDVSVNEQSVLRDVINDSNLQLPDNVDQHTMVTTVTADAIDAYKHIHWKEKTVDGAAQEDEEALTWDGGDIVRWDDNSISVQGFDYTKNFTAYDAVNKKHHYGEKLIVRISGLTPVKGGVDLLSNSQAGIYTSEEDTIPFLAVDSPEYTIPVISKVIDFNAKMNFGENNSAKLYKNSAHNGEFTLENAEDTRNLIYQLKYKKNGEQAAETISDGAEISYSEIDTTMTYEIWPDEKTGEELKEEPGWKQYFAVPANAIYFDDELLNKTVKVGSGDGFNSAVSSAEVSTTDATTKFAITFTGKRIDLYCTTDASKNGLSATVSDADGNRVMFIANNAEESANRFSVQNQFDDGENGKSLTNVPTLSIVPEAGFGTYTVTLTATAGFRLDGVRIYNPIDEDQNETAREVYESVREKNAVFQQVRQMLLDQDTVTKAITVDGESVTGAVYIEKAYAPGEEETVIETYTKAGPKNEVYLDAGQGVGFQIDASGYKEGYKVMVGLSAPAGKNATVKLSDGDKVRNETITSNVDMYYSITPDSQGNVIIYNTPGADEGMISVTNIKITGDRKLLMSAQAATEVRFFASRSLLSYAKNFDALEVSDAEDGSDVIADPENPGKTDEPIETLEPEKPEEPTPTIVPEDPKSDENNDERSPITIVKRIVQNLLKNISRLFGGWSRR